MCSAAARSPARPHSGAITVEGNQSAGIAIDSALAGSLTHSSGAINVTGDDSAGIRAADVSGNVILSGGSIGVKGQNSVGLDLTGDIGGALVIQNAVSATGYRSTTAPADVSKLDADDLLQGGPAVSVAGTSLEHSADVRPADADPNDTDEDMTVSPTPQVNRPSQLRCAPALRIARRRSTRHRRCRVFVDGYGIVIRAA